MAEPKEPRDPMEIIEPVESDSVYQLIYFSRFSRNQLIIGYLTKPKSDDGLGFTHDEAVDYLRQKLEATCLNLYIAGRVQVSMEELHLRAWEADMPKALSSESCSLYNMLVDRELKSSEGGKIMSKENDEFYSRKKQEEGTARALETVKELFSDYQRLPSINGQKELAGIGRLLMKVWDATSANRKPSEASIVRLFIRIWNCGTSQEIYESHPPHLEDRSGAPPSTRWCEDLGYNYYELLNEPEKCINIPAGHQSEQQPRHGTPTKEKLRDE
ncbi:hypothetical protein V8F33_007952 [Rhypophila sp. PSN 637]